MRADSPNAGVAFAWPVRLATTRRQASRKNVPDLPYVVVTALTNKQAEEVVARPAHVIDEGGQTISFDGTYAPVDLIPRHAGFECHVVNP
jgi:hypothetical protein